MSIIYCATNAVCGTFAQWTSSLGREPRLPGNEAYTRSNRNDEDPVNHFATAVPVLMLGSIVGGAVAAMTIPPGRAASYAAGAASVLAVGAGLGCPPLLLASGVFSLGLSACSYWVQRSTRNALARETATAALRAVQPDIVRGLQQYYALQQRALQQRELQRRALHEEFSALGSEIDTFLTHLHPAEMAERGETPLDITNVQVLVAQKFGVRTDVPWGAEAYAQAALIRTRRDVALRTTFSQIKPYEGNAQVEFADAQCPITQYGLADLDDPVLCRVGETYQLCSFKSFQEYWIRTGKNIFSTAGVADWADIVFLKTR